MSPRRSAEAFAARLLRQAIEAIGGVVGARDDAGGEDALHRTGMGGVALDRVRQRRRQQRRLARVELARPFVEIMLRGGLDAEHAVAPLGDVEVDLDGARLRPDLAENQRDADFDPLANGRAARPQEQVLGGLHGDRRRAAAGALSAGAADDVMENAPFDAVVLTEPVVFRSDDGRDGDGRDVGQLDVDAFVAFAYDHAADHQRRDRPRHGVEGDKRREYDNQRQPREDDASRQHGE